MLLDVVEERFEQGIVGANVFDVRLIAGVVVNIPSFTSTS